MAASIASSAACSARIASVARTASSRRSAAAVATPMRSVISHQFGRTAARLGPSNGVSTSAWFKFRNDSSDAGIYGSQGRDEYDDDDVEHYFNYMGMLAVEGTYDRLATMLQSGIHPADLLLLMAAQEGDKPKIEELLEAGADKTVKDSNDKMPVDLAKDDETRALLA